MSTILGNPITLGGGGGKLNIDFGTTPPSDTSKLWVPLSQKPSSISLQTGVDSGDFAVKNISITYASGASGAIPQYSGTAEDGEGGFYCFGGGERNVYNDPKATKHIWYVSPNGVIQTLSQELLYESATASCARVGRNIYIFGGSKRTASYVRGLPMIQKFNIDTKVTELIWSDDTQYTSSAGGPWSFAKLFKWGKYLVLCGGSNNVRDPIASNYGSRCIRFFNVDTNEFKGYLINGTVDSSSYLYAIAKNSVAGGHYSADNGYVYNLEKRSGQLKAQNANSLPDKTAICSFSSIPMYFLGKSYTLASNGKIYEYFEDTNYFSSSAIKTVNVTVSADYGWCYNDDGHVFIPRGGTIFDLAIKTPLANNNMIIALDIEGTAWKALNTNDISAVVYPIKVLVGDATGYAETKDAYLYDSKTSKWTKLDGSSTYQDMLNALNIMGVN